MIPARPAEHRLVWWLLIMGLAALLTLTAATTPLHGW
jgi:hypothetical protein